MEIHLILHLGYTHDQYKENKLTFMPVLEHQSYYFFFFFSFSSSYHCESYAQIMLQDISHPVAYFLQMMQLGRWHKLLLLLFTIKLVSQQ